MLKLIIALVLLAHGIGHSMGLLQIFNVAVINPAWRGDSWLLGSSAGSTAVASVAGVVVWTASIVGFAALAAVVMGWLPVAWWAPLAVGSAIVSLVGLLLFPLAFPTVSTIGAFAVDVVVLVAVLWADWEPGELAA
jgi:hypothetical protein